MRSYNIAQFLRLCLELVKTAPIYFSLFTFIFSLIINLPWNPNINILVYLIHVGLGG